MEVTPVNIHKHDEVEKQDLEVKQQKEVENSENRSTVKELSDEPEAKHESTEENSAKSESGTSIEDNEPEISVNNEKPVIENEPEDDYTPDEESDNKQLPAKPESTKSILESLPAKPESTESILKSLPTKPNLPSKPPVVKNISQSSTSPTTQIESLKDAFEAIKQTEIMNDPNFHNLSPQEQAAKIQDQLNKRGIHINRPMNYNQVYSFNKPFKNLKDPIPLVPINEFCRRPNITAPMTPEEEQEYEAFIQRENHYLNLQNWDEFPDKSRLFIGNLPANTISKQDLFRIFSQYGEVIQIAIKAGYGFTQFRTAEACAECIKGETGVPLHNKILRLDASKPQKSRRPGNPEINNPNFSARGRERELEGEPSRKKRRGNIDCIVYVTGKSSVFFIRKVKKAFANLQITVDTEDVTQRNITDVLSEAAYSGVLGACVIKEQKIDLQTYENTSDGGIKFDEYADIEPEQGAEIMSKAKFKKYGNSPPPYIQQESNYNDNSPNYGNRGNSRSGRGGGRNNRRGNDYGYGRRNDRYHKPQPQPYGSFPQQPYAQQPQIQRVPYGSPPQQQQPYGFGSPPQQQQVNSFNQPYSQPPPTNNNLMQALQGLNPSQVQNLINALQNQQQPAVPAQQQPYSFGNYNQQQPTPYQAAPPNQNPSNQVNALLAQLQQTNSNSNSAATYPQSSNNQQSSTTEAFLDTLKRLSNK
ncbi:unnamed protein product [Candida verbasci]|uniref:RRM domain-containing protein n=1 Tax=Candida verbasci TaxID=1227364 RepID=A0A9W4U1K8_9ASCO|nr:unnamed protein product [Candida verbasci]